VQAAAAASGCGCAPDSWVRWVVFGVLVAGGIASFRVFAGYAGWGPGQLQDEIDEGAWYVVAAEPADVFDPEPEQLWRAVLRRSGGALALVATYPDDPSLN